MSRMTKAQVARRFGQSHAPVRGKCRCCGCTEEDCRDCLERTGRPCTWADESTTLCSACVCALCGTAAQGLIARVHVKLPGKPARFSSTAYAWCAKCRSENTNRYRSAP